MQLPLHSTSSRTSTHLFAVLAVLLAASINLGYGRVMRKKCGRASKGSIAPALADSLAEPLNPCNQRNINVDNPHLPSVDCLLLSPNQPQAR
jgi:hypothetical protein